MRIFKLAMCHAAQKRATVRSLFIKEQKSDRKLNKIKGKTRATLCWPENHNEQR